MKMTTYEYGDGNGNAYIITTDSIEYVPVKKENSSTGNYSGGEPVKKKITESDYQQVQSYVHEIFGNASIHIKDRMKGSGRISVVNNQEERQVVIIWQCDEKEQLEGLLTNLIR
jgi:hypothetical protein